MHPRPVAVADGQAGRLLAAVLQGEEPEEGELGDALAVRRRDPEHAAFLPWTHDHSSRISSRTPAMRSPTG